jgi:hypothetical protein
MSARAGTPGPIITLDVDWAPDFIIDSVAGRLRDRGVRATWFVTHASPAIERLRAEPELFELGLHPNFLPGSTHGATPAQVLAHVGGIVPGATSSRSHAVCQSGPILTALAGAGVQVDVTLFLPGVPGLRPFPFHIAGRTLLRAPYNWSDDYEMYKPRASWDVDGPLALDGLRVFNFHPVLVYINARSLDVYEGLKAAGGLPALDAPRTAPLIAPGDGAGAAFDALADRLARDGDSTWVRDLRP